MDRSPLPRGEFHIALCWEISIKFSCSVFSSCLGISLKNTNLAMQMKNLEQEMEKHNTQKKYLLFSIKSQQVSLAIFGC